MWASKTHLFFHVLVVAAAFSASKAAPGADRPAAQLEVGDTPYLPAFLEGTPEDEQTRIYTTEARAPHRARGKGLHEATTGVTSSFSIQLVGEDEHTRRKNRKSGGVGGGDPQPADWKPTDSSKFIYVWISSKDQMFIAEVTDDGADQGVDGGGTTLTATYMSDFPGDYLVYVEEVVAIEHVRGEGRPIVGSPFSLTITTDDIHGKAPMAPTLDVNSLPVCGSPEDPAKDIGDSFWRPGTWLSSNVASPAHGVLRDGWVFQPKTCVYDTFSYDDLMLLSALQDEPTWILILGGSVQRGVFLSLVDMVLARGQKDDMGGSVVQKCWGYADLHVGNIRVTYQDLRLYQIGEIEDSVVCNNEKLVSGSTNEFLHSCEKFMNSTIFRDSDGHGPTVVMTPSNLVGPRPGKRATQGKGPRFSVEVMMDVMPPTWKGKMMFVEHMAGFECRWSEINPTRTALKDVGISYEHREPVDNDGLDEMDHYQRLDPRVSFLSMFPMNQAKLFENQSSRGGVRRYAGSVHYHYVSRDTSNPETHDGERMVQSTMTEMIANIVIGKAIGTKAALYEKVAAAADKGTLRQGGGADKPFKLCWDCPSGLLPVHVKSIPEPVCLDLESLPVKATVGVVWDGQVCPAWCMKQEPESKSKTESDVVSVRKCRIP